MFWFKKKKPNHQPLPRSYAEYIYRGYKEMSKPVKYRLISHLSEKDRTELLMLIDCTNDDEYGPFALFAKMEKEKKRRNAQ